jgi:hypothetical protein
MMNQHLLDLLAAFNAEGVRYLVVGGYAFSVHTEPRGTKDLDVFVADDPENTRRLYRALAKYGAPLKGVDPENFWSDGDVYQVGVAPVRADVLQRLSGVAFDDAWPRRVTVNFKDVPNVPVIGVEDLLRNKEIVARPQDLVDAQKLRKWHKI